MAYRGRTRSRPVEGRVRRGVVLGYVMGGYTTLSAAASPATPSSVDTQRQPRMTPTRYDAIVIGAGQAGPPLAVKLAEAGMKTALIEREHLGGTCVNDGCTPTKTLVASARAAHVARRAADWGVRIDGAVSVDMKAVKARMDRVVAQSVEGLDRSGSAAPTA